MKAIDISKERGESIRLIFIDEMSMVVILTMNHLLKAISAGSGHTGGDVIRSSGQCVLDNSCCR